MSNINVEEALESLFSEYNPEMVEVELPSRGKGYLTTKSTVGIRPMNYEDEKFIASYSGTTLMDDLISRCSSTVDLEELYLEDKLSTIQINKIKKIFSKAEERDINGFKKILYDMIDDDNKRKFNELNP